MKRFSIFGAVSWFCLFTFSQAGFGSALGVQGGINSASLSTTSTVSGISTSVFQCQQFPLDVWRFLRSFAQPIMNLQIEANYASFIEGVSVGTVSVDGLAYLAVPLFIKAKLSLGLPIKPFFMAGPDFMLKISGNGYKSTNIALDFGGGVEVSVAPLLSLIVSARYSMGLTNILETSTSTVTVNESKTRALQILGGVAFGF